MMRRCLFSCDKFKKKLLDSYIIVMLKMYINAKELDNSIHRRRLRYG
jgi:hypothetical protein